MLVSSCPLLISVCARQGVEHGVSQIAKRSSGGVTDTLVWNYPLDVMFRSSNVHGWPQVVLGVYGLTAFGGDVVRGYGCVHVPTHPGRYTRYVQLYTPVSSSLCQRLTAWVTNNPPEFFDSKFIAQGKGREVTRVRSHGVVKISFNVTTKNMSEWGYQVSSERSNNPSYASSADAIPLYMQQQQPPQQPQPSPYEGSRPASASANANNNAFGASGGGGGLSSRSTGGGDSARGNAASQSVPPRTQLSAATTANMAAAVNSSRRMSGTNPSSASVAPAPAPGIAPPSQANSRENSRRDLFAAQQQQQQQPPTAAFAAAAPAASASSSYSNYPSSSSSQQQYPSQFQQSQPSQQHLQGGSGFDSSTDEFEAKYPSSTLSQRGSSLSARPAAMDMQPQQQQPMQMQGMGLAPLRSGGGRQLPPM